jgi:hypothetical protein
VFAPGGGRTWKRGDVGRELTEIALPDRAAIELNYHPVRREDRPFIPPLRPNMAVPVDPGARRLTHLIQQSQIPTVLGNEGNLARGLAILDAPVWTGEIDTLCKGLTGNQ